MNINNIETLNPSDGPPILSPRKIIKSRDIEGPLANANQMIKLMGKLEMKQNQMSSRQ